LHSHIRAETTCERGVPVIHVILVFRKIPGLRSEGMTQPFWQAITNITDEENWPSPGRKSTVNDRNFERRPQAEIIPKLYREGNYVINNKKHLDYFHGTDLENLLHILGVKKVHLMGINTNTCVQNIQRYLGWVLSNEEFKEKIEEGRKLNA
jgi:nicotinamidase-related amidase